MSGPGLTLARVTASRRESRPSFGSTTSATVVTAKVAGTSRPSRSSTARCFEDRGGRCDADITGFLAAGIAADDGMGSAGGRAGPGRRTRTKERSGEV